MKKFVKVLKFISFYAFVGILIGFFVGIYQLGLSYIIKGAAYLIKSDLILLNIIFFVSVAVLSIVNFFILKFDKDIDGTGTIQISKKLQNNEKMHNKLGILTIIVNSYVSSFCLMPLGGEAPSLVLASRIGSLCLEVFNIDDKKETINACLGAGFGCAFLSPLAGLSYMIEHEKRVDLKLLLKGLLVIGCSFVITLFINKHHTLSIVNMPFDYELRYGFLLFIIAFISCLFATLFNKLSYIIKSFFSKHKDNFIVKYRSFLLFVVSGLLAFFFINLMGSGMNSINYSLGVISLFTISVIFLIRFFITIIFGLGKVSGGLVVPVIVLGGLISYLVCLIFFKLNLFDMDYVYVYIVSGMCMFFAFVNFMPFTGSALFLSAVLYSSKNIVNALPFVFILLVSILLISLLNKKINKDYSSLIGSVEDYLA